MKKLGPVSFPQDHPSDYHRRLVVMLYQYFRDLAERVNALIDASGSGGGTVISGTATVTVPANSYFHEQSVTLTGCTATMNVVCSLARHEDTDENSEELLHVTALSADAGTDAATVRIAFSEPTSGPVKLNLLAA